MVILLFFLGLIVAAGLVIWRVSTQSGYRVKNRDEPIVRLQGRSADRTGPDLRKMLD